MKVKDWFYIGMTKAKLNVRLSTHRADYKTKPGWLPSLHKMWNTMSQEEIDESIASTIVLETKPGTRYRRVQVRKEMD